MDGASRGVVTDVLLSVEVPPEWDLVRTLRGKVGLVLADYPLEFRSAAVMTAAELLENAVKFGEHVPRAPFISFNLSVAGDIARIETINGSTDPENIAQLKTHLDQLATEDKEALYVGRLEEMLAGRATDTRFGLYRIAVEGQFALGFSYEEGVVTVFATRAVPRVNGSAGAGASP